MFRVWSLSAVTYFAITSAAALIPNTAAAGGSSRVEVTVTNITRNQIISPVVIASHTSGFEPLFELGSPATDELVQVAEDAKLDSLIGALSTDRNVRDVVILTSDIGGPIPPGESASVIVKVSGKFRYISMVAMLVTTNDAFFALRGVRAPRYGTSVYRSPAYDSGSEDNNEDCVYIPGPPCKGGGVRDTDGAEGYVHIHGGIHGIASLAPSVHDWRNPVANIKIERIR